MTAEIALTGLAANDPVPGDYLEVQFGVGGASSGSTAYNILLLGNKTSAGSAVVDTTIYGPNTTTPLATDADAQALFGVGSELHRMWKRVTAVNTSTTVSALAVTESVGANATLVITLTTTATGAGALRIFVGDEYVDTPITSGDTPTVTAAAAVLNVNGKTSWGVTAGNSGGVLTLTAKQKGLRGNWLRAWSRIFPSCGMTTSTAAPAYFTGGTTADSNVSALATILSQRFYYIVSAAEDATQLGALVSQVRTQALPITGIRQRVLAGSVDTLANATTVATGLNEARAELVWLAQSDVPPCELAANQAAIVALYEAPQKLRTNFAFFGDDPVTSTSWKIKPPISGAAPTRSQIKSALLSGLSPIGISGQSTYLVDRITTHSLTGSNPDVSIRPAHKVTVPDRYADDLSAKNRTQFRGKNIGDDPAPNQPDPDSSIVTPRAYKASANKLTHDYDDIGLLQNVATIIANTQVVRSTSNAERMTALIPLQVVDCLKQTATLVQQVR